MADEKTNTTETTTKKGGVLCNIITSIICLLIGAGAMFGIDYARVQDAIDEGLAKQVIADVTTATVADTIANEGLVSVVITDEKKAEITAAAVEKNTTEDAIKKFIADAKAAVASAKAAAKATETAKDDAKKVVDDVKAVVEEVKDKVEGATEAAAPAADAAATVTENAAEAAPAVKKD